MTRLSDVSRGRENNLNLIRMTAALAVLVSHAWPITRGEGAVQPLLAASGYALGTLAVFVFFAISGFLIARSYERQPTVRLWMAARVLRLFPALAVMLLLSILVLGPLTTTLPLAAYFADPATASYLPRNLSLAFRQSYLPGVFETQPIPWETNGSLWTLWYEVLCYACVLAMGLAGAFRSWARLAVAALVYVAANGAAVALPPGAMPIDLRPFLSLAMPFACGVAFYLARERLPLTPWALPVLIGVAVTVRATPLYQPALVLALTYGVFLLAFLPKGLIRRYNGLGDYSYGVYIYAWPVQQAVVLFAGTTTPLGNILVATPIVLVLAVLSWTLIEKPALGLVRHSDTLRRRAAQEGPARP